MSRRISKQAQAIRARLIAERKQAAETNEYIASIFGITEERVRQILMEVAAGEHEEVEDV